MRADTMAAAPAEKLLTYKHMADALGVSERTVWTWVRDGHIRTVPLGPKCVRFHPAERDRVMREGVACPPVELQ